MNFQPLILGPEIFQALQQCFDLGTRHCQLKNRLTHKILRCQQKCAPACINIRIYGEIMRTQLPVSVVSQPIPEFFLEGLPAGFKPPLGHLAFVFRQGPEHQFCQNLGPGGAVAIFPGNDTAIFKSRTIRAG